MKFSHINVHNVNELIPPWAIDPVVLARSLDELFESEEGQLLAPTGIAVHNSLKFWVEVDVNVSPPTMRVCTPDEKANLNGRLIIDCSSVAHERAQIDVPLNPIFKGADALAGTYLIYLHSFQTEVPLGYVGMTRQRWFERYAQHISSARSTSPLLFHQALRKHQSVQVLHKVFLAGLDQDHALNFEEEFVGMFGLYPRGLNMIPGGRAGFVYLAKLGLRPHSVEARDTLLEAIADRESIEGRPNPLCAARWATDESFVERIICGHSGRLTAEQVRQIRLGAFFGKSPSALAQEVSARNLRQVQNVLTGRTYTRIKQGK